jgi:hypothetical protein
MDKLGRSARRRAREISLIAEKHGPSAPGGVTGDATAIYAAADDRDIEGGAGWDHCDLALFTPSYAEIGVRVQSLICRLMQRNENSNRSTSEKRARNRAIDTRFLRVGLDQHAALDVLHVASLTDVENRERRQPTRNEDVDLRQMRDTSRGRTRKTDAVRDQQDILNSVDQAAPRNIPQNSSTSAAKRQTADHAGCDGRQFDDLPLRRIDAVDSGRADDPGERGDYPAMLNAVQLVLRGEMPIAVAASRLPTARI